MDWLGSPSRPVDIPICEPGTILSPNTGGGKVKGNVQYAFIVSYLTPRHWYLRPDVGCGETKSKVRNLCSWSTRAFVRNGLVDDSIGSELMSTFHQRSLIRAAEVPGCVTKIDFGRALRTLPPPET